MKIFTLLEDLQSVILEEDKKGIYLKLFYSDKTREFSCTCLVRDENFFKKRLQYKEAYDSLILAIREKKHDIEMEL